MEELRKPTTRIRCRAVIQAAAAARRRSASIDSIDLETTGPRARRASSEDVNFKAAAARRNSSESGRAAPGSPAAKEPPAAEPLEGHLRRGGDGVPRQRLHAHGGLLGSAAAEAALSPASGASPVSKRSRLELLEEIPLSAEEAAMSGAPQGPVYRVEVLRTEDFAPSQQPEEELRACLEVASGGKIGDGDGGSSAGEGDWAAEYAALDSVRRLCIHHKEVLLLQPGSGGAGGAGAAGSGTASLTGSSGSGGSSSDSGRCIEQEGGISGEDGDQSRCGEACGSDANTSSGDGSSGGDDSGGGSDRPLDSLVPFVCVAAGNLRSTIVRNALFCAADMFSCLGEGLPAAAAAALVAAALQRCAGDKKFIRDAAAAALAAAAASKASAAPAMAAALPLAGDKSVEVAARAVATVDACMATLFADIPASSSRGVGNNNALPEAVQPLVTPLLRIAAAALGGRALDGRAAAKRILLRMREALGGAAFEQQLRAAAGAAAAAKAITALGPDRSGLKSSSANSSSAAARGGPSSSRRGSAASAGSGGAAPAGGRPRAALAARLRRPSAAAAAAAAAARQNDGSNGCVDAAAGAVEGGESAVRTRRPSGAVALVV